MPKMAMTSNAEYLGPEAGEESIGDKAARAGACIIRGEARQCFARRRPRDPPPLQLLPGGSFYLSSATLLS